MNTFIFSKHAQKSFKKLSPINQKRVLTKLKFLKTHENIFFLLKPLQNLSPATHRLRIGSTRILLKHSTKTTFCILKIAPRNSIYK